jgi:FdrA protein
VHGLYCGGTLAAEAHWLLRRVLDAVDSNLDGSYQAGHANRHAVLDLGAEAFTRGRPHPMIDPEARRQHLLRLAEHPGVAVVLCDVILGWGAHEAPGVALAAAWQELRARLGPLGRQIIGIATVCGAPDDPQNYASQCRVLKDHGFILAESNAQAVRLAAHIVGAAADPATLSDDTEPPARQPEGSGAITTTPPVPSQLPSLLREGPRVINLGLEAFAAPLRACGAPVLHVDWQPPAGGNAHLASMLERLT